MKSSKWSPASALSGATPIWWSFSLAFACRLFDNLFRTLAVLWTRHRCHRVKAYAFSRAFQNPGAPSPTASLGAFPSMLEVEQNFSPGKITFPQAAVKGQALLCLQGLIMHRWNRLLRCLSGITKGSILPYFWSFSDKEALWMNGNVADPMRYPVHDPWREAPWQRQDRFLSEFHAREGIR